MRTRTLSILVAAILLLPASRVAAAIVNPGFETGDFTGWSTIGLTSVLTKDLGIAPLEGTSQGFLSTGGGAVPVNSLEPFLGLGVGSLTTLVGQPVIEGSGIKQTFSVNPGDRIQFAWNFLTNEDPFKFGPASTNDTSFAIINGFYEPLANTQCFVGFDCAESPSSTGFFKQTGWKTFLSDPLTGGSVTLAFGVADVGNSAVDSGLLLDAVPEPSTLVLFGTSLAGIGMWWRSRQRRA